MLLRRRSSEQRSLVLFAALFGALVAGACGDSDGTGASGGSGGSGGSGAEAGSPPTTGGGGQTNGPGGAGGDGGSGGSGGTTTDGGAGGEGGSGGEGGAGGQGCGSLPVISQLPTLLSQTGLYDDIAADTVASYVRAYQPKYPLWSDDAEKERWAYIPECETVDTSDMDTWQVPVGSRFWKQFTRDGVRIETRIIVRTGPAETDFKFGAYVWDGDEAVLMDQGVENANGTDHDVPPKAICSACHKRDWRILGFSALQLTHDLGGANMQSLSDEGVLSVPNPTGIVVPGDAIEEPALGYLHANCGNCHYDEGVSNVGLRMRLLASMTTVETTSTYLTAVGPAGNGVPADVFDCDLEGPAPAECLLIAPGSPTNSGILQRMTFRGSGQMPPYATEVPDTDGGVASLSAWITSLGD